jgi:shikimate dehydrogenase
MNAVFIPFLVENVEEFFGRIVRPETSESGLSFGGLAVTMPHKQTIIPLLDEVDEVARRIGAVNTVSVEGSRLIGHNTDASGFLAPLETHFGDVKKARVGVFGAGGAARACIYALIEKGASVKLFARNAEKAKKLADDFGIAVTRIPKSGTAEAKAELADLDILVDATPFGMSGETEDERLFAADELQSLKFVYDLVTKAYDTPVIREAKRAGVPALGGVDMLVAQGVEQFKIWTGLDVPAAEMKENVLRRLGK